MNNKNITKSRDYLGYIFLLGIVLCVAGIVAGIVSGNWSLEPIGLLVAGVVVILLWLRLLGVLGSGKNDFWQRRSTVAGTNAFVSTLAVLVILGLINFLASRYYVRLDLTENQLFTLSPQSQQIVQNLSSPLKVWVFDRQTDLGTKELLENYHRYGSNFEFEFVDIDKQTGLAQRFNVQYPGDIYVEYGEKKEQVPMNRGESLSEVKLTNAIEKIQQDISQYIYFVQGHGELPLDGLEGSISQAVTTLDNKGYTVKTLNLLQTSEVPENANVIVFASPKKPLFKEEIQLIKDYLNAGGRLLLALDPNTNPGLEPLLTDWGVQLDNRLVIDASDSGSLLGFGPATALINNYGNHPITKDFGDRISVYPGSRPIKTSEVDGVESAALVLTNEQSWAESNLEAEELVFDPKTDIQGPLDVGVALTRSASKAEDGKDNPESRMVVFGSSTFLTNGLFESPQLLNGDIFLNSIKWLSSDDDRILSIRPKEQKNRRIYITPIQAGIIVSTSLIIMPLFGLITAGIVWWRRR